MSRNRKDDEDELARMMGWDHPRAPAALNIVREPSPAPPPRVQRPRAAPPPMFPREDELLPLPGIYPCYGPDMLGNGWTCSERLRRPGVCLECGNETTRREFDEQLLPALRSIPEVFRWAVPGTPHASSRIRGWDARIKADVEAALASDRNVVFVGGARRGKTSAACLALRWGIETGRFDSITPEGLARYRKTGMVPPEVTRARASAFVAAEGLKYETAEAFALRDYAVSAAVLVFDDLGAELDSAPLGSGHLPTRIGLSKSVIERRHLRRGARTFFTTPFGRDKIAAFFGDGIAGRVFEGAIVVDLGAAEVPAQKRGA